MHSLSLVWGGCVATLREAFFGASLDGAHFFIFIIFIIGGTKNEENHSIITDALHATVHGSLQRNTIGQKRP